MADRGRAPDRRAPERGRGILFAEYMENTRTLAAICQSKYRTVAIALRALLCTVVAYATLLFAASG